MVTCLPAAPLDPAAVLPDVLIDQYVKPGEGQTDLVKAFRQTALVWVERHTSRSLMRRNWVARYDGFDSALRLPCVPVRAVTGIAYRDPSGAIVARDGFWQLCGGLVMPLTGSGWPSADSGAGSVIVTFDAGYDDLASDAPALQIAALMMVKHLFDGGSLDDVPATIGMLIDEQYRTPVISR